MNHFEHMKTVEKQELVRVCFDKSEIFLQFEECSFSVETEIHIFQHSLEEKVGELNPRKKINIDTNDILGQKVKKITMLENDLAIFIENHVLVIKITNDGLESLSVFFKDPNISSIFL